MRKLFFILISFLYFVSSANAQDVSFKATLNKNKILIGEQVIYQIQFEYNGKAALEWPQFSDTLGSKHIEITAIGEMTESGNEKTMVKQQQITITVFDSGYYSIPPCFVIYNGDTIESNPVSLEVHTVEVDTSKAIKDIKEIYEEEYSFAEYLQSMWEWMKEHWYYVAGGIVAIAVLLFFLLRKKKPEEKVIPKIILPADVEAFQKLKILENKKLWQNDFIKEYYVELSDIIRGYIERRYSVQALEQTTNEIMHNLRFAEMKEEQRQNLNVLLKTSDMVKFAKEKPLGNENETAMQKAVQFIESTKTFTPKPEQE